MKLKVLLLCLICLLPVATIAGPGDSIAPPRTPYYKNVIKFNPTPMLLWDWRNITFSYERILNARQSISLELGYLVMPRVVEDTLTDLVNITSGEKNGINVSLEYRFYLTKLNARPVPAGLYLGPYFTFYGYQFKNGLDIFNAGTETNGTLKGNYWAFNLGLELGYQFVFWKHWTLDMVLVGPSVSYFGGKTEITGDLNAEQIQEINQELYDKLVERFPGIQVLSIDKTYQQTGKLDILRMGFRYLVQIGYHF